MNAENHDSSRSNRLQSFIDKAHDWLVFSRSARLAAVGASALSVATFEPAEASVNPRDILQYPCYVGNPHFSKKVCHTTREAAEAACAKSITQVTSATLGIKARYVDGSKSRYKVSFTAPTAGGCWPGGKEVLKVTEQIQNGPSGTFTPNGKASFIPTAKIEPLGHVVKVSTELNGMQS